MSTALDDFWQTQLPLILDSVSGMTCTLKTIAPAQPLGADGAPTSEATTTTTVRCSPLFDVTDDGDNAVVAKITVEGDANYADLITINSELWTATASQRIWTGTRVAATILTLHRRGRVAP
jgi:hypothetical protein